MSAPHASLFISHGAPTLAVDAHPARQFLQELGLQLPRPRAVVVVSPHWMTEGLFLKAPARFATWHDFQGFPPELYRIQYRPAGEAALQDRVALLLREARIDVQIATTDERLDHGAWVPLMLMYPQADVPIVQLSLTAETPRRWREIGQALRPLAADGVLLVGSGGAVHNLRELDWEGDGPPPDWAREFDAWVAQRLADGDWDALCDYRRRAPHAARAHPTEEHFLPLFFAGGAGGAARLLHDSFSYGSIGMATYGFS